MLNQLLAVLFLIALVGAISTYFSQGKRWWGSRGYRVRIVRRNALVGLGVVFVLLLVAGLRRPDRPAKALPRLTRPPNRRAHPTRQRTAAGCSRVTSTRGDLWVRPSKPERWVLLRNRALAREDAFRRGPQPC